MSNQVWKYRSRAGYLLNDSEDTGEPVSDKISFDEARVIRDSLKENNPDSFYGIKYFTSVKVLTIDRDKQQITQGDNNG